MESSKIHRAGFVTLVGRTNVGKSTLLNRLVGQKVAIVTPRPQTTRRRIVGIVNEPDAQILLVDTPGFHEPRSKLNQRMVDTARRSLSESEVVLVVIEAGAQLLESDRALLDEVARSGHPLVVALNKIDTMPREYLMAVVAELGQALPSAEIVPISALKRENLPELIRVIKAFLPESPPLMPEDEYTDQTERMIAAEVVREKIFLAMRQEIPFSTAVEVENFEEVPERELTRISAAIIVERDSHKGMMIGARGQQLKLIGTRARLELERILGRHIFLELNVRVEKGWTDDPRRLKELGF
ncbi:MAG TPA: GTPase Era [Candidatus Binataceae bacterium]|nr:GTPase Era [Candidatus Binataceae bacterium]